MDFHLKPQNIIRCLVLLVCMGLFWLGVMMAEDPAPAIALAFRNTMDEPTPLFEDVRPLELMSVLHSGDFTLEASDEGDMGRVSLLMSGNSDGLSSRLALELKDSPVIEGFLKLDDSMSELSLPQITGSKLIYDYRGEKTGILAERVGRKKLRKIDGFYSSLYGRFTPNSSFGSYKAGQGFDNDDYSGIIRLLNRFHFKKEASSQKSDGGILPDYKVFSADLSLVDLLYLERLMEDMGCGGLSLRRITGDEDILKSFAGTSKARLRIGLRGERIALIELAGRGANLRVEFGGDERALDNVEARVKAPSGSYTYSQVCKKSDNSYDYSFVVGRPCRVPRRADVTYNRESGHIDIKWIRPAPFTTDSLFAGNPIWAADLRSDADTPGGRDGSRAERPLVFSGSLERGEDGISLSLDTSYGSRLNIRLAGGGTEIGFPAASGEAELFELTDEAELNAVVYEGLVNLQELIDTYEVDYKLYDYAEKILGE